jgi:flagellar motor protein MotB
MCANIVFSYTFYTPILAAIMRYLTLLTWGTIFLLCSCVSARKYKTIEGDNKRLKNDSILLEKRIRVLADEVNYLATKSAQVEQLLNQRIQEKQDSLTQKEAELHKQESFLNDMKARRVQEREAFAQLSRDIMKPFSTFGNNEVALYNTCTQTVVEVSDKLLFLQNSTKLDASKSHTLFQLITQVLSKQPDLKLLIVNHTDSVINNKEKMDDNWSLGNTKATLVTKTLIKDYKIAPQRLITATQAENQVLEERNIQLGKVRTAFIFYSELIPCLHLSE